MADIGDALLYFAVFLFSTTLHEAAHAWAALKGGDPTAYEAARSRSTRCRTSAASPSAWSCFHC